LRPNYLLYVSSTGTGDSIWKLAEGTSAELWRGKDVRIVGGPAIAPDGRIAFSTKQGGRTQLHVMLPDGTSARVVSDSFEPFGDPAWAPDSQSITTAAEEQGVPHLFRVPLDGGSPVALTGQYSVDPAWAPDGSFVVYSGPDIGTTFAVKAMAADGAADPLPGLTLTRGARHLAFLAGGRRLVVLRGEIQHKNLWMIDLDTGTERQLTDFAPNFDICDFDITADGREVVLERVQESSDVVMLELPRR
jgi:Tol biopolymer transport system component